MSQGMNILFVFLITPALKDDARAANMMDPQQFYLLQQHVSVVGVRPTEDLPYVHIFFHHVLVGSLFLF